MSILDKYRKATSKQLVEKIKEQSIKKNSYIDERQWSYTKDKTGNAYAIVRFLPNKDPDKIPYVTRYEHSFQNAGKWYIVPCSTTKRENGKQFGECYVCQKNSEYYAVSKEHGDNNVSKKGKSRKTYYFANILVIKDSANPDNDNKVFTWKFGKKIMDLINDKLQPMGDDEQVINPFDPFNGVNLKLKIRTIETSQGKQSDYSQSKFEDEPHPLYDEDEKIVNVLEKLYDVYEYIDDKEFQSYDKQKERYNMVHGVSVISNEEKEIDDEIKNYNNDENNTTTDSIDDEIEDDDEEDDYFKSLE